MLKIYSKGCEYAIRALSRIHQNDYRKGFSVNIICKRARIPVWFTRKIFQALVKHSILITKRGPGGGYRFKKNPSRISLLSIVEAIDGEDVFKKCVLGRSKCNDLKSCVAHFIWRKARVTLISKLRSTTIKQLMNKGIKVHSYSCNGQKNKRNNLIGDSLEK